MTATNQLDPLAMSEVELAEIAARLGSKSMNSFHPTSLRTSLLREIDADLRHRLRSASAVTRSIVISMVYQHVLRSRSSYKGWSKDEWVQCYRMAVHPRKKNVRPSLVRLAYGLTRAIIFAEVYGNDGALAQKIAEALFGAARVNHNIELICGKLREVGYSDGPGVVSAIAPAAAEMMLAFGEPEVTKWPMAVPKFREHARFGVIKTRLHAISVALCAFGIWSRTTSPRKDFGFPAEAHRDPNVGVAPEWLNWIDRWAQVSTHALKTKNRVRRGLVSVGRWLAVAHPNVTSPEQWDVRICAEFVAAVSKWKVGQYIQDPPPNVKRQIGQDCKPGSKLSLLSSLRIFFSNLQEWSLTPVRFNVATALRNPRSVTSQADYAPRVIADDVWAKLLYAGITLTADDLPRGMRYPIELVRAIVINWLFSGIRNDELLRLSVDAVEREPDVIDLQSGAVTQGVCYLWVPANKYKGAFRKPVDPAVGEAIMAWQRVRPPQPPMLDRKTGRKVERLFAYRGSLLDKHYARPDTKKLAQAYASASYFRENVGRIKVLLDVGVIESGRAAAGEPYKYYDLGHGYCKHKFFSQCPHRMASVRCSFYLPKEIRCRCAPGSTVQK